MTRIQTYQHGMYPRSEALVGACRELERGRTTPHAVMERLRSDVRELVDLQREAGLDSYSDGLLRWQDMFRPLVDAADGLRPGALVRWLDDCTFFRAPVAEGRPALPGLPGAAALLSGRRGLGGHGDPPGRSRIASADRVVFADLDLLPEPRVATLPSPYLFSRAAQTALDRNYLMHEIAVSVLRPLARALVDEHGFDVVHLQEPWLARFGIEDCDWPSFERALAAFRQGVDATVVLHLPFGDAGPWAARLRELPVDAIGIDFVATDPAALGGGWRIGVLAGCIDARRWAVEPVEPTVAFVQRIVEALDPPVLFLSSATDLDLLPRDLAAAKVRTLGECARRLRRAARGRADAPPPTPGRQPVRSGAGRLRR